MRRSLSDGFYNLLDRIARKIPPPLLRTVALPVNYQIKSKDNVIYESARMIDMAFAFCMNNKVRGDYAEFGVFRGRTTIEAYRASRRFGFPDMRFLIFDSFEGLPPIAGNDVGGPFVEGEFSCSRREFTQNLKSFGVDVSRFEITEGFYDQTLTAANLPQQEIAVAWVDCDLYESTVPVLNYLTHRLVNGAVLIFDDWYCFDGGEQRGEQLAYAEWLAANPNLRLVEYQNFHWAGKSFIVNRLPVA